MKTKTGQLLMMYSKSKSNQFINHNQNQSIIPQSQNIHQNITISKKPMSNKQQIPDSKQNNESIVVTQTNKKIPIINSQQINEKANLSLYINQQQNNHRQVHDPFINQNFTYNPTPSIKSNQFQLYQINQQKITFLQSQNYTLKQSIKQLKRIINTKQKQLYQLHSNQAILQSKLKNIQIPIKPQIQSPNKNQKLNKFQQKCSALQVQNYRLIQSNYMLLLNLKKNIKSYQDCLIKVMRDLQSLQYAQAHQKVTKYLTQIKHDKLNSQGLQKQHFPQNYSQRKPSNRNSSYHSNYTQKKQIGTQTKIIKNSLKINYQVIDIKHYIQPSLQQKQNSIQVKINKLPPYTARQIYSNKKPKNQSSSFHIINNRNQDSQYQSVSSKLFNSQIHQLNDYQILDHVSLHDKIQANEQNYILNSKKTKTFKIHGNTTQLYYMLMSQAIVIQQFIQQIHP